MTPKEMYIRVVNDLSGLAAQRSRKFLPEQVELELNAEVEDFILSALKENHKGFYDIDAHYIDAVQPLIKRLQLPVYASSGFMAELPVHFKLLGLEALRVSSNCNDGRYWTKSETSYFSLPFMGTDKQSGPFYKNVALMIDSEVVYQRAAGGYSLSDPAMLIDELTASVPNIGWETFGEVGRPGSFIVRTTGSSVILTFDGSSYDFTLEKKVVRKKMKPAGTLTPVRRIKNQMVGEVVSTAYYKPSSIEVPVTIEGNIAHIYTDENATVNQLLVTYIRRPRKISLSLNTGCELATAFHGMICDRTVQRIRERIGDPKYQTGLIQENR